MILGQTKKCIIDVIMAKRLGVRCFFLRILVSGLCQVWSWDTVSTYPFSCVARMHHRHSFPRWYWLASYMAAGCGINNRTARSSQVSRSDWTQNWQLVYHDFTRSQVPTNRWPPHLFPGSSVLKTDWQKLGIFGKVNLLTRRFPSVHTVVSINIHCLHNPNRQEVSWTRFPGISK